MSERYAKYNKLKFDYPADRVLRITFDRPETFNSVDAETHTQMTDMWIDIDRDPDINAVIVTGAGKAFSAGGDFSLIENMIGNSHEIMKTWKEAKDLVYNIINCNKPIISAINGPAAGAGLVVAILADISIAGNAGTITLEGNGTDSDLKGDLTVGGNLTTLSVGDDIEGAMSIGGNAGSLTAGDDFTDALFIGVDDLDADTG